MFCYMDCMYKIECPIWIFPPITTELIFPCLYNFLFFLHFFSFRKTVSCNSLKAFSIIWHSLRTCITVVWLTHGKAFWDFPWAKHYENCLTFSKQSTVGICAKHYGYCVTHSEQSIVDIVWLTQSKALWVLCDSLRAKHYGYCATHSVQSIMGIVRLTQSKLVLVFLLLLILLLL